MNELNELLKKSRSYDEYYMYIIMNNDLKMDKGKLCSQSCHAACRVTRLIENINKKSLCYINWLKMGEGKIVLKATEKQIKDIIEKYKIMDNNDILKKEIWCIDVIDAGRTQIPTGSLTAIAFCPMKKGDAPDFIKELKLL